MRVVKVVLRQWMYRQKLRLLLLLLLYSGTQLNR